MWMKLSDRKFEIILIVALLVLTSIVVSYIDSQSHPGLQTSESVSDVMTGSEIQSDLITYEMQ